jgi:hypothetical protein
MEDHMAPEALKSAASTGARRFRRGLGLLSLTLLFAAFLATGAQAASVNLGTAGNFSVLAGSAVTNTGSSVFVGDVGVSPQTSITGFPPGTVFGTIHAADAVAGTAQSDLTTAYNDAAGRSSTATVSGDLAGRTLSPGVYTSASSLGLTGNLTLDAHGDKSAVFVFQAGSTLTTQSGSRVLLTGGAQSCNVYWQVGSSATIGTSTAFTGNILALTSISLTTNATLDGSALARNGAVTLDSNVVSRSRCASTDGGSGGSGGSGGGSGGSGGSDNGGSGTGTNGSGPHPTTRRASRICDDRARLRGQVPAGLISARYYFQFGTSKRYGRRTASIVAGSGIKAVAVETVARRLRASTTYHYRLVAVDPSGNKSYGHDRVVRTGRDNVCAARNARTPSPHTPWGFTG